MLQKETMIKKEKAVHDAFSYLCFYSRKQRSNFIAKAGLLTYFIFCAFPFRLLNSGVRCKRLSMKLTASGNVQDLHLVPFSFRNMRKPLMGQMY